MTTPVELYNQKVISSAIQDNSAQRIVVNALAIIYQQIMDDTHDITKLRRWLPWQKPLQGMYLWGGVGRGKTFLVDLLYACLPPELALRIHFQHFMQQVHTLLTKFQGHVDPLEKVAIDFRHYKVLIFDEFYVNDITDAMLLGTLLQKLLHKGMILVATSNIPPDLLYLHGLQRSKFLPAIAALKKHCHVLCLDSDIDFRMRALATMDVFHYPLTNQSDKILAEAFHKLAPSSKFPIAQPIMINERAINTQMCADNVVWFDFNQLCATPRSASDYIQLATIFDTLIISNVPIFDEHNQDIARRFIELIDELYDRKIKLVMSLATDLEHLWVAGVNSPDFQRTISRLQEMRSQEYMRLARI